MSRHSAERSPRPARFVRYGSKADITAAMLCANNPIRIGVPFSVARIPPGRLKVLDALISMNLIRLSAWL